MPLRRLAEADLDIVRDLRNANRQFFLYDKEVSPEQHRIWFRALSANPIDFYVIEDDGAVVGTISVTRWPLGVEIGNLVLDTAARGKGLMRRAVAELSASPGHYFAEVKHGNTASLNVFLATGFAIDVLSRNHRDADADRPSGELVVLSKDV